MRSVRNGVLLLKYSALYVLCCKYSSKTFRTSHRTFSGCEKNTGRYWLLFDQVFYIFVNKKIEKKRKEEKKKTVFNSFFKNTYVEDNFSFTFLLLNLIVNFYSRYHYVTITISNQRISWWHGSRWCKQPISRTLWPLWMAATFLLPLVISTIKVGQLQ